jgi:hypothetical protein
MEEVEVSAASGVLPERLGVRRLVLLGGLALGLVAVRAVLRDVHVPGHVALPTLFSLVLARFVAPGVPAASGVAATSGLLGAGLGMGGGVGGVVTPLLAGAVVDAAGRWARPLFSHVVTLALLGAVAGFTRFVPALAVDAFAGPSVAAVVTHAALAALPHAAFGALGAALAPAVLRARGRRRKGAD